MAWTHVWPRRLGVVEIGLCVSDYIMHPCYESWQAEMHMLVLQLPEALQCQQH